MLLASPILLVPQLCYKQCLLAVQAQLQEVWSYANGFASFLSTVGTLASANHSEVGSSSSSQSAKVCYLKSVRDWFEQG